MIKEWIGQEMEGEEIIAIGADEEVGIVGIDMVDFGLEETGTGGILKGSMLSIMEVTWAPFKALGTPLLAILKFALDLLH